MNTKRWGYEGIIIIIHESSYDFLGIESCMITKPNNNQYVIVKITIN